MSPITDAAGRSIKHRAAGNKDGVSQSIENFSKKCKCVQQIEVARRGLTHQFLCVRIPSREAAVFLMHFLLSVRSQRWRPDEIYTYRKRGNRVAGAKRQVL
jgi:hypothetical protein